MISANLEDKSVVSEESQRSRLYSDFQPLVCRLISQYGDTNEMREDLQGEIYYLFQSLIDRYDPNRGVPLRAYLVYQLNVSVYTMARKQWRQKSREVSLDLIIESGNEEILTDYSHDEWKHQIDQMIKQDELQEAIQRLTARQRQVVIWRYYEFYPFEEIAELLSVKPATVRSLLRHGLNNLRSQFAERFKDE